METYIKGVCNAKIIGILSRRPKMILLHVDKKYETKFLNAPGKCLYYTVQNLNFFIYEN